MKMRTSITSMVLTLVTLTARPQTVFYGEDVSPRNPPPVCTNQVPRRAVPNSLAAWASFTNHLTNVRVESFDGYPTWSRPTNIYFGTDIATLWGERQVWTLTNPAMTTNGAFPIFGTNMLVLFDPTTPDFFQLNFSSPQAAFGFFATDAESNQVRLKFFATNTLIFQTNVPATTPQCSGGAFFFGFINQNTPFTRVEFGSYPHPGEGIGFDDFTIATTNQISSPKLGIRVSEAELSWASLTNQNYSLQYRSEITGSNWNVLECVPGNGTTNLYYDKIAVGEARRFYRLEVTNCVPEPGP